MDQDDHRQAIAWAEKFLPAGDIAIHGDAEPVRDVPWSSVTRFQTSSGAVYLKQMAPAFSIEAKLLTALSQQGVTAIPSVLGSNEALNCFLMTDAGLPLRDTLKADFQIVLLERALTVYAAIQKNAVPHVGTLLELGLPDWRLEKLPQLYARFIEQDAMLAAEGLKPAELETLRALQPRVTMLCDRLSQYKIPETLEHGDFQDNNVFMRDGDLVVGDWGDTVISHPFFSAASCLKSAMNHHNFIMADPQYSILLNTYLEVWQEFCSLEKLREAFILAKRLKPLEFALSFSRVQSCDGMDVLEKYSGYIAEAMREFYQAETSIEVSGKALQRPARLPGGKP